MFGGIYFGQTYFGGSPQSGGHVPTGGEAGTQLTISEPESMSVNTISIKFF